MRKIAVLLFIILYSLQATAQNKSLKKLQVFIDCSRIGCDLTFIRSEIKIVDFLLDRQAADVHVLITAQRAGGGGSQYQLIFYGQQIYKGYTDTLLFTTARTATKDEIRQQLVQGIMIGIAPLVARTAYASAIAIDMKGNDSTNLLSAGVTGDRWNYWIFNLGIDGEFNADKIYKSNRYSSDFSADRTTKKLKAGFRVYGSKRVSVYEYEDSSGISKNTVNNSEYGFYHHLVKALGPRWSYGYQANYTNNTFSNYKRKIYLNPSIEYNIYPYLDVNNRFFVLRYGIDVTNNNYYDTTLYNRLEETLYGQKASATLTLNQKWGTFYSSIYYRNYFHNWKLNNMGVNLNVNVRVTGGLSFYINTSGNIVHDQVYLVKGNVTEQDVLTRKRQLASNYNYRIYFGINFRFGSKLNNFINPRFQGYGGF
jgi:hypothetical protein